MRAIGIRASTNGLTFAIIETSADGTKRVLNVEPIRAPKALLWPEALKYLRNNLLDVILEYDVQNAGLRIAENTAESQSIPRIQIEAVLQEAFSSSDLKRYYVGQIATIARRVGIDRSDFKKYVDGSLDFEAMQNWSDLKKDEREAVLTALGAINA